MSAVAVPKSTESPPIKALPTRVFHSRCRDGPSRDRRPSAGFLRWCVTSVGATVNDASHYSPGGVHSPKVDSVSTALLLHLGDKGRKLPGQLGIVSQHLLNLD